MKKKCITGIWNNDILKKCFRMMKIFIFTMVLSIGQLLATESYSQSTALSLNFNQSKLVTVLDEIEDQTDYFFLFNEKLIDVEQKVTISVRNQRIQEVLDNLFAETNIRYQIVDRKIVLSPGYDYRTPQQAKEITVKGKVTDQSGQSLTGVTVVVKGTTRGTITDLEGNYTLVNVPGDASLVFFFYRNEGTGDRGGRGKFDQCEPGRRNDRCRRGRCYRDGHQKTETIDRLFHR